MEVMGHQVLLELHLLLREQVGLRVPRGRLVVVAVGLFIGRYWKQKQLLLQKELNTQCGIYWIYREQ
jgi:hypothetical protein